MNETARNLMAHPIHLGIRATASGVQTIDARCRITRYRHSGVIPTTATDQSVVVLGTTTTGYRSVADHMVSNRSENLCRYFAMTTFAVSGDA